jgi:hypothetical protein
VKHILVLIAVSFIGLMCSHTGSFQISMEENGTKIVSGQFSRDLLAHDQDFKDWYEFNYKSYTVDESIIPAIDSLSRDVTYIVFLGTWCSDSKREVPHLLKIFDAAHVQPHSIELYGVDRAKKSPDGFEGKYNLTLVPTVIVERDSVELGRIVEEPKETLEKDLLNILSSR